ncbi:MAG TPA: EAL domain-containing protein [Gammaproteobacteria bacterium]|nr:EAL domain-containing protein [Gammaproteobacteria bacterium]
MAASGRSRLPRWIAHPIAINYGLSLLALVLGLLLTAWAWRLAVHSQSATNQAQFRHVAQQAANTIRDRFTGYATLVRSGQALFASAHQIEARRWRDFVHHLSLKRNYPAVIAFDYVAHVRDDQLLAFQQRMLDQRHGFKLHDLASGSLHCIVQYEAPLRPDSPGPGGDMCGWPNLRAMINETLVTGAIVVSRRISLNTRPPPDRIGVVMTGPVYHRTAGDAPHLTGWVSAVLSINRILAGVLASNSNIELTVTDASGAVVRGSPEITCRDSALTTPCLSERIPLTLPGRDWTLVFRQPGMVAFSAWKVAAAGLVISLLLALTLLQWGRVRTRALALANEMTEALRDSENLLLSVTNNIFEGIYRGLPDSGLQYINKSLATMFGYKNVEEMRAAGAILYADPRRRDELRNLLERNGYYRGEEVEYVRRDGSHFVGVNNAVAVYDDKGKMLYFDGAISDVTARKTAEARLWNLARYDSLTGLANRASFRDKVRQEINRASRAHGRLAVLFLDIDRFKTVNDFLGHSAGDKLLKAVAERIHVCLDPEDIAGREGGDEFLILLTDVPSPDAALRRAEDMLQTVAGSYTIDGHDIAVTPSIGVSLYPTHGDTVDVLIRDADAAMYHAKSRGRYNVQLFTPDLDVDRQARVELENDLRDALKNGSFTLHYQPQVEIGTGRIVAAEALLRWHHTQKGEIPPNDFIPVAEQCGLIVPIGEWVLREACRQNRAWQLAGLPIVPVAVNISAVQFLRRTLHHTIFDALRAAELAPQFLELELTETVVMQDIERTSEVLDKLQRTGIRFAIDDFGTGYSSLSYLRWFKIGKLKIDQSFVRDITTSADHVAIIEAIIGLAKNFRLRVVAEGVETREQLEFLREQGCEDVQGYYFSKPVVADEFARHLRAGVLAPDSEADSMAG